MGKWLLPEAEMEEIVPLVPGKVRQTADYRAIAQAELRWVLERGIEQCLRPHSEGWDRRRFDCPWCMAELRYEAGL